MPTNDDHNHLLDQIRISRLEQDWGLWRDTGRWERLRAAYAPDATMVTTWSRGTATAFVDACERGFGKGPLAQHFMGPCTVDVVDDRAVAELRVMLLVRDQLDGVPFDITCYARFCDRLVRVDGRWLIASRMPIYEKDSIAPLDPARPPAFDQALLASFPGGYKHLAYMQSRGGATITQGLPAPGSPQQEALYREMQAWLHAG